MDDGRLTSKSDYDGVVNALRIAILVTAVANVAWIAYVETSRPPTQIWTPPFMVTIDPDYSLPARRFRVELALIIGLVFLMFRRRRSVAMIAFAWIISEYLLWWLRTYNGVHNAEALTYAKIDHLLYLGNANAMDVWILCVSTVTLCVLLAVAWSSFRVRPDPEVNAPV